MRAGLTRELPEAASTETYACNRSFLVATLGALQVLGKLSVHVRPLSVPICHLQVMTGAGWTMPGLGEGHAHAAVGVTPHSPSGGHISQHLFK